MLRENQEKGHPSRAFWTLMILAAVVRLAWLATVPTEPVTDFAWYFERAVGLANGQGYTVNGVHTAYWPAGYPLFLSFFFKIFGSSVLVGQIVNTLLTFALVPLTYVLASRLFNDWRPGLVAGALVAFHPQPVAYSSILASEPLYTVCLVASFVLVSGRDRSLRHWAAAGALLSLATLVRPQALLFLPLLWMLASLPIRKTGGWKPAMVGGIALVATFAMIQAPWMVRNLRVFNEPVFVSTNGGDNLWIGHNPRASGRYQTPPESSGSPESELRIDKARRADGMAAIRENPSRSLGLVPEKLAATFARPTDAAYWAFQTEYDQMIVPGMDASLRDTYLNFRSYSRSAHWVFLALGGLGLVVAALKCQWRPLLWAITPVAVTALLAAVFFGNPRFFFPCVPFIALLIGAVPFAAILEKRAKPELGAALSPDHAVIELTEARLSTSGKRSR